MTGETGQPLRKPCTRCLLIEAGERDMSQLIRERIAVIPDSEKADAQCYAERLATCRQCGYLNRGTCGKCGCYVELRAARKDGYCADYPERW